MSPISRMWYLQVGGKHPLFSWQTIQYSFTHKVFFISVCRNKVAVFLKNFYKSWESLVTSQLPSDYWVVFWTNKLEKQDTVTFCTNLPKKERGCMFGHVTWQWPKMRKISLYGNVAWQRPKMERISLYGNVTWQRPEKMRIEVTNCSYTIILYLSFEKINHIFQLPAFYVVHLWVATLLLSWTS